MSLGNEYVIYDLLGGKCGMLICYAKNVMQNVRAIVLRGAKLIFAPHVTDCTPSAMPGRAYVDGISGIRSFENEITISNISKGKIELSGGWRYRNARRPELYKNIIGQKHYSYMTPI